MSEKRKSDHINLTFDSRPNYQQDLGELYYEPLLSAHPVDSDIEKSFLGTKFDIPLWVSSMTGGTAKAKSINTNLAKACAKYNLGMGLGSCRALIDSHDRFDDFNMRPIIGNRPLYSNFGIAQLEQLVEAKKLETIVEINKRLEVDGMIIHVNPLQEWAQAEGDTFRKPPLETIKNICDALHLKIIVKEVGQGFGPKSLKSLCDLPIQAIELAGFGGTNFTILEQARLNGAGSGKRMPSEYFANIGHSPSEMIAFLNEFKMQNIDLPEVII